MEQCELTDGGQPTEKDRKELPNKPQPVPKTANYMKQQPMDGGMNFMPENGGLGSNIILPTQPTWQLPLGQ